MLYEILPDVSWFTLNKPKQKSGPHVDGIVGSTQSKSMDFLSNKLQQLLIQRTVARENPSLASLATQTLDVHSVK
jgi:hypothetical protein